MIKVLIADDHTIVREGLKQILTEEPDIEIIAEADNGNDALHLALEEELDVAILDISMPGKDGLEVLKTLQQKKSKLPVLILTMYPEDQYAMRVMRAGAAGYLTKKSASEELITAIHLVATGRKYVTPSLTEKLVDTLVSKKNGPLHEKLSDREYQVMCMIASGKKIKVISEKLCLSPKTVSTYQTRILEKICLENTAELIRYALDNQLVV